VVGGKWKFLILWHLAGGLRRFGELRRLVVDISEKLLIQELKEMELDGIVSRKDVHEVPPRVEFSLTSFGRALAEALQKRQPIVHHRSIPQSIYCALLAESDSILVHSISCTSAREPPA
jgi:DNA-binding HxlR family transcriptional regulator